MTGQSIQLPAKRMSIDEQDKRQDTLLQSEESFNRPQPPNKLAANLPKRGAQLLLVKDNSPLRLSRDQVYT